MAGPTPAPKAKWFTISYRHEPIPDWFILIWLISPFGALAIDEKIQVSWLTILACAFAGFLLFHAIIALHELGHVVAGQIVGIKTCSFTIGNGRKLAEFKCGSIPVIWNLYPISGFVRPMPSRFLFSLSRNTIFLTGGLAIETLLACALYYAYRNPLLHEAIWSEPIPRYLTVAAGFYLLVTIFSSIWPGILTIGETKVPSDALQIWNICKSRRSLAATQELIDNWHSYAVLLSKGEITAATELAKTFNRSHQAKPNGLTASFNVLVFVGNPVGARRMAELALLEMKPGSAERLQTLDGLATLFLNSGLKEWGEDADRWSALALSEAPGSITLKGTRGSVLAELGRNAEAQTLLQEVLSSTESDNDRAFCLAYLAWIDAQSGIHGSAREKITKAKSFKLPIEAITRLEKVVLALQNAPQSAK